MDIPGYIASETRFLGWPVLQVSFRAHTCVGDQEFFIPNAAMAIVPWGKGGPQKALLQPPPPSVTGGGGDGGGAGGVAGVFQSFRWQQLESW
jgi:hypothetical protein